MSRPRKPKKRSSDGRTFEVEDIENGCVVCVIFTDFPEDFVMPPKLMREIIHDTRALYPANLNMDKFMTRPRYEDRDGKLHILISAYDFTESYQTELTHQNRDYWKSRYGDAAKRPEGDEGAVGRRTDLS